MGHGDEAGEAAELVVDLERHGVRFRVGVDGMDEGELVLLRLGSLPRGVDDAIAFIASAAAAALAAGVAPEAITDACTTPPGPRAHTPLAILVEAADGGAFEPIEPASTVFAEPWTWPLRFTHPNVRVRSWAAQWAEDDEAFEAFSKERGTLVAAGLARNVRCPGRVLRSILRRFEDLGHVVARNPGAGPELLAVLGAPDAPFRSFVARNPTADPALLASMADDVRAEVRTALTSNPSTPLAVIAALGADGTSSVRAAAAGATRPEGADERAVLGPLLDRLLLDESPVVRSAVADSPHTEPVHRVLLALDERPSVQARAIRVLSAERVLTWLAFDRELPVRSAVARNPATPDVVLEQLAADAVPVVQRAAASTLSAVWTRGRDDPDPDEARLAELLVVVDGRLVAPMGASALLASERSR